MCDISSRIQSVIDELASGNVSNFSKLTDIPYSTLHGYLKGRLPHSEHLIRIRDKWMISIDWLLTGNGHKFVQNNDTELLPLDPNPEIAELMEGARRVLTSGIPEAFDALERNIRYFSIAIAAEKRADKIEKKIEELEADNKLFKEEILRLRRENSRLDMEAEAQSTEKKVA